MKNLSKKIKLENIFISKEERIKYGISFEFYKNEQLSYPDFTNNTQDYFYLFSKVGTPVFTAFDPNPYDPLHERDTLITGSLTEVKTNGNWK